MFPAPAQLTPATCCLKWFGKQLQVSHGEHYLKSYADQAETVLVCLSQVHDVYYLIGLATVE